MRRIKLISSLLAVSFLFTAPIASAGLTTATILQCSQLFNALAKLREDRNPGVPKAAFEPEVNSLPPSIAHLIAFVRSDAVYGARLDRVIPPNASNRDILIAFGKDPELRRLLNQAAHSDLIARSNLEKQRIEAGGRKVDALILGAGLVEQNFQNSARQQGKKIDTLTVEETNVVASTFARGGSSFYLNSTSRPPDTTSLRQKTSGAEDSPLGGDLNFLPGGVLQVNQFDSRNNPLASSWGEAAMVNRSLSEGNILFNTRVVSVEPVDPESVDGRAGYLHKVKLSDGSSVLAKAFLFTGLGPPVVADIPGLRDGYSKYGPKGTLATKTAPRIMTFNDFRDYVNSTPNPYKIFSGANVGVVGPGDSGKAVVRYLLGLSDPSAYGEDFRDIPLVNSIPWFGQVCISCESFIAKNRSFYADLGRGFRSGRIVPLGKLAQFNESQTGPFVLKDDTATDPLQDVNILILTTGFESEIPKILRPYLGAILADNTIVDDQRYFQNVTGYEPSLGQVNIAKQFIDPKTSQPTGIFVLGPPAGRTLVSPSELVNVPENYVANVNHSWRAYRFGEALANGLGRIAEAVGYSPKQQWQKNGQPYNTEFTPNIVPSSVRRPQPGDAQLLTSELYTAFSKYDLKSLASLKIIIGRTEDNKYILRTEPSLYSAQLNEVIAIISKNEVFGNLLNRNIGPGERSKTITVDLKFETDGSLSADASRVSVTQELNAALTPPKVASVVVTADMLDKVRNALNGRGNFGYNYAGAEGYSRFADIYFGNDMAKAYDVVAQIYGAEIKELSWGPRIDLIDSKTFEKVRAALNGRGNFGYNYAGAEGYSRFADIYFGNDMAKAYDVVAQIYGTEIKELSWGPRITLIDAKTFEKVRAALNGRGNFGYNYAGAEGYSRFTDIYFGNDMAKAYDVVAQIYGAAIRELGWGPRIDLIDAKGFERVRAALNGRGNFGYNYAGAEGYSRFTDIYFGNDMAKAYDVVAQIYGAEIRELGWGPRIDLIDSKTFEKVRAALNGRGNFGYNYTGTDGYANMARYYFKGDLALTYDAVEQIYGTNIKELGWSRIPPRPTGNTEGQKK